MPLPFSRFRLDRLDRAKPCSLYARCPTSQKPNRLLDLGEHIVDAPLTLPGMPAAQLGTPRLSLDSRAQLGGSSARRRLGLGARNDVLRTSARGERVLEERR